MTARVAVIRAALLAAAVAAPGCAATEPYDYGPYLAHMPRTLVVLPPTNESVEPLAPYNYLSTVTAPLAERGYYVLPVAIVDEMLKENGLPTPAEMHTARLDRLREILGADAVLYLHVKDWGTSYRVIDSTTTVRVTGRLVDTATGTELWHGEHVLVASSASGQQNALAMLVSAIVTQVVATASDRAHDLAGPHAVQWLWAEQRGLLLGPRHAGYEAQQNAMRSVPLPPAPPAVAPRQP